MFLGLFCILYPITMYLFSNVNNYLPSEQYVYLLPEIIHSALILGHIGTFWFFLRQLQRNKNKAYDKFTVPTRIKWGVLTPLMIGFLLLVSGSLLPGPISTRNEAIKLGRSIASHWYAAEGRDLTFSHVKKRDEYWVLEGVASCPNDHACKSKKLFIEIDETTGWISFYDFKYIR